jgi:siroheme synthase
MIRLAALTTVLLAGQQQKGIAQGAALAEEEVPCWVICGIAGAVCIAEAADWGLTASDCAAFVQGCMAGCQAARNLN